MAAVLFSSCSPGVLRQEDPPIPGQERVKTVSTNRTITKEQEPVPPPLLNQDPLPHPDIVYTDQDEVYYYQPPESGKVSVRITPWAEGHRYILLYDIQGKLTYVQKDSRKSYSEVSRLSGFHDNGALSRLDIHLNPGGSMYWYETSLSFGTDNNPQWKVQLRHPPQLEDRLNNKSYWDIKSRSWKKQEIIREQPVPDR